MKGLNLLVIGKNSFIAKHFCKLCKYKNISINTVSHNELPLDFSKYHWVINFSQDPDFFIESYTMSIDQDAIIAEKLKSFPSVKLAVISSRMVYKNQNKLSPINENSELNTTENKQYGLNKIFSENSCKKTLGLNRLLIVRASNIFGLEVGRHTFMGIAQKTLIDQSKIILDINKETKRDFIPVDDFCIFLLELIQSNNTGVINIGSGVSTSLNSLCQAIIKGYGKGKIKVLEGSKLKDQFVLDTTKLRSVSKYNVNKDRILKYAFEIGQQLKR